MKKRTPRRNPAPQLVTVLRENGDQDQLILCRPCEDSLQDCMRTLKRTKITYDRCDRCEYAWQTPEE